MTLTLMYFIEDIDLQGYNALQIYDGLWQTATEQDSKLFSDVKIVAARCEQVYPITFIRGNRDYYGIDIDLTARLKEKAMTKQVVIDSRFHEEIMKCYTTAGNKEQFRSVRSLECPEKEIFKGIPNEVTFFRGR